MSDNANNTGDDKLLYRVVTRMAEEKGRPPTLSEILYESGGLAIKGGAAGAAAMFSNVAVLMWMRTTVSDALKA